MKKDNFLPYYRLSQSLLLVTIFLVAGFLSTGIAKETPIIIEDDVPIESGFERETVVSGLEHPWGMVWLPDGNLLVTERPGRLRLVEISLDGSGRLNQTPVAGLPAVFASGQGGLLDISMHPDFAANKRIYLSYADGSRSANRTRVARAVYEEGRLRGMGGHF